MLLNLDLPTIRCYNTKHIFHKYELDCPNVVASCFQQVVIFVHITQEVVANHTKQLSNIKCAYFRKYTFQKIFHYTFNLNLFVADLFAMASYTTAKRCL